MWTNDSAYLVASALSPYYTSTQVDALPVSTFTNDANYSTTTGTVTPTSTDTFTNKSGNISMWTNDAGYLTTETDSQTLSFSVPNLSISGGNSVDLTPLTLGYITADSTNTLTNKSGNISMFTNDANYSTTTGTVTPTSTDTFTNKSGNISQWTNDSGYLTAETDSQTLSFTSPNLTISNGNTVDIGSLEVATIDGGTY